MCIVDQDQAKAGDVMSIHREHGFAPDLIDEAMALRVAAGAVDLTHEAPRPYFRHAHRGFARHLSASAGHEIQFQSVHRA